MRHVNKTTVAAVVLCAAGLAGCASGPEDQQVLANYRLPLAQYEVQATYQLQECPTTAQLNDSQTASARTNITATITAVAGVDPRGAYQIQRRHVSSARTSGEATVTFYPNRTIKTINAVSEDRTGAIVTNVIGAISSAARIAGVPLAGAGNVYPQPCTTAAIAALARKRQIDARIDVLERSLLNAGSFNADAVTARRNEIAALRLDRQTLISNRLSFNRTFTFTPTATRLTETFQPEVAGTFVSTEAAAAVRAQLQIGVQLMPLEHIYHEVPPIPAEPPPPVAIPAAPPAAPAAPAAAGAAPPAAAEAAPPEHLTTVRPTLASLGASDIVLREPVLSRLFVCKPSCTGGAVNLETLSYTRPRGTLASADVMVPQLGDYRAISLRARWFQRRAMEVSFGQFGDIDSVKYSGNAQAEAATAQVAAALERMRTARDEVEADIATRDVTEIQRETAVLDAQRQLLEARRLLQEEVVKAGDE